ITILAGGLWYNAELQVALAKAEQERERAEAKSQEAVKAAELAKDALKYFVDAFRRADPSRDGSKGTVAEALKRTADELPEKRDLGPASRTVLLDAIGLTYLGLGLPHDAVRVLEAAMALVNEARLDPDHPQRLKSMNSLAFAYRDAGRVADALPL